MFLQVLPEIKKVFLNDELHLVIGSWSKDLVNGNPYINKVIYYDNYFLNRGKNIVKKVFIDIISSINFVEEALKNKYDMAIDFRAYFPNMIPLLIFGNIKYRIGFTSAGLGFLLNHSEKWKENIPETEHFLDLIRIFSYGPHENKTDALDYLVDIDKAERLMNNYRINTDKKLILVHPFGGNATKKWEINAWKKVIRESIKNNCIVILVGQHPENPFVDLVDNQNVFSAINKTDIKTLAGLIKKAELVIGMDSFPAQFSIALNRKTIVIMSGIENRSQWYDKKDNVSVLQKEVDCSPCYRKNGCEKMSCLEIGSDEVVKLINSYL